MTEILSETIQEHLSRVVKKLVQENRIHLEEEAIEGCFTVYILEINESVWSCNGCRHDLGEDWEGSGAFYVGITNKTREERIAEHELSHLQSQGGSGTRAARGEPWKNGAKMTRHHGFVTAEDIEPVAPDGRALDGRLTRDHAKLLEQIVIPTALRTLGFAAYAGAPEQFVVPPKTRT